MRMLKAYKYRIYPTKDQKELIKVIIGACRFVYNWALEQKIKTYEQDKKSSSRFDLQRIFNLTVFNVIDFVPQVRKS